MALDAGTAATPVRLLVWTRTRPAADGVRTVLAAADISLLDLPLIGTRLARRGARLSDALQQAARDSRRIYVSVAAVEAIARLAPDLLHLPAAAVGPQTAEALRAAGCRSIWQSAVGQGADALLALPQWSGLHGATVTLLHAPGGREAPFERLADMGVHCRKMPVYQRYRRRPTAAALARLQAGLDQLAWLVPSVAVCDALADLLATEASFKAGFERPVLTLSERIAMVARQRGFGDCRVMPDLQLESLLAGLRALSPQHGYYAETARLSR